MHFRVGLGWHKSGLLEAESNALQQRASTAFSEVDAESCADKVGNRSSRAMQCRGEFIKENMELLVAESRLGTLIVELEILVDRIGLAEVLDISVDGRIINTECISSLLRRESRVEHQERRYFDVVFLHPLMTLFHPQQNAIMVVEFEHRACIRLKQFPRFLICPGYIHL